MQNHINMVNPDDRAAKDIENCCPCPTEFAEFGQYIQDKANSLIGGNGSSSKSGEDNDEGYFFLFIIWGRNTSEPMDHNKKADGAETHSVDSEKIPDLRKGKSFFEKISGIVDRAMNIWENWENTDDHKKTNTTSSDNKDEQLLPTKVFERKVITHPTTGATKHRVYDTLVRSHDHESFEKARKKDSIFMSNNY